MKLLNVCANKLPFSLSYPYFNSQIASSTLTIWFKTIFNGGCYWEGLMAFLKGPYWARFVAVDCIALNYLGKHKQDMTIRGIN